MVISYEFPSVIKTLVGFLHFVFYLLMIVGVLMVPDYSLFGQKFHGFESQLFAGIISSLGIVAGILILKSIKTGNYLAIGVVVFLTFGVLINFLIM